MVTLKDIARQAGVSIMTVSRVMNDQQGKVSPQTAEKVRRIAEEMGYIPNSSRGGNGIYPQFFRPQPGGPFF